MATVYLDGFPDLYMTEYSHNRVRGKIYKECWNRQNNNPDIILDTKQGLMLIIYYINHFHGLELEISIDAELYNINIAK